MFFLKELPTEAMLDNYAKELSDTHKTNIMQALDTMRQASLLVRSIDQYFASNELSQLRFLILIVIDRELERDYLSPNEIATRLDVSKPVLTRTIKKLIDDGLLISEEDKFDKRAKQISLTDAGKARLYAVLPGYFEKLTSLMAK